MRKFCYRRRRRARHRRFDRGLCPAPPLVHEHMRMNPEDRAAFADARIAAVHAGLKLSADQEKLWPPVETAVRDFAKMRIDRANARMKPKTTIGDGRSRPIRWPACASAPIRWRPRRPR